MWPYRVPIFSILNEKYDLTVTHSIDKSFDESTVDFKVKYLPGFHISRFFFHKTSLHKLSKGYDIVIGYGDISWLSIVSLLFIRKRKYKVILWGIGVRASRYTEYGTPTVWDKVRYYLMQKADAVLFYSSQPIPLYEKVGFSRDKLHVANNTVVVNDIDTGVQRDVILFVGTLYKQKKIYELLENYLAVYNINKNVPNLEIIGGGEEYISIKQWIDEHNLNDRIVVRGKIFDENKLSKYFSKAIACISPGQAGLSVLKSMGYGVPFISIETAITGGEIFNIENNVNGILYKDHSELKDIILDITENTTKYLEMGKKAKEYYDTYRTPQNMAKGISDAIEYVSSK